MRLPRSMTPCHPLLLAASLLSPAPALAQFADFSQIEIATSNMTVTPIYAFVWETNYHVWLIYADGGGFSASFTSAADGDLVLQVRHQTSAYAGCPGGGYSPVTIRCNGVPVVERYNPTEHHGFTFGIDTDAWRIPVRAGENTLEWTLVEPCTCYWIRHIELLPYAHAEADVALGPVSLAPLDYDPASLLQAVDIVLTNLGPTRLASTAAHVELELYLSRDATLSPESDLLVGRHSWDADLGVHETNRVVLGPEALAHLAMPCSAWGDYRLLARVAPASPSTLVDPHPANNVVCLAEPVHVTPRGDGMYVDFSCRDVAARHITVELSPYFVFNTQCGGNRALVHQYETAFYAYFDVPQAGAYDLSAYHLTAASAECQGGGYSPISIYLNNATVVENHDPAEQHGETHGYVTDTWRISALAGDNMLEWVGGELCTTYWLQRFEVTPADVPIEHLGITRLRSGEVELMLHGQAGASLSLQVSTNLVHWSTLTNVLNVTGTLVYKDAQAASHPQRFYQALPD